MTDYSAALIDARKQLEASREQAELGNLGMAIAYCGAAILHAEMMRDALTAAQERQNAQRAM